MNPPFTAEQFFQVLAHYNQSVWPGQLLWVYLALVAVAAAVAFGGSARADRAIVTILGFLWLWMGAVYHWLFFKAINPAAVVFGVAFVVEGILLLVYGFRRQGLHFVAEMDIYGFAGAFLIFYALVLYPIIGVLLGHRYPDLPTFGLPCPGTIFTMGMLLWGKPRISWILLIVPVLWSIVGSTAVGYFGIYEDAMLPAAAIAGSGLVLWKNHLSIRPAPGG